MFWTKKPTPPNDLSRYQRKRVIVTDVAGNDYAGALESVLDDCIVLKATIQSNASQEKPLPLDGEIVILRGQILFVQVLG
jgi:hypothetical protein